jgi:twitching motility protein PilT
MAQLDKLLAHIAPRGGMGLSMEADRQPMLLMASGVDLALLPNPIPSTMIEMLAREVLPHHLEEGWNSRGEASFDHVAGSETFRLTLTRGPQGLRIQAAAPSRAPSALAPLPGGTLAPLPGGTLTQLPPRPPAPARPQPDRSSADRTHPLTEALFAELIKRKGSDLHCSSFENPLCRVHGDLEDLMDFGILGPNQLLEVMEAIASPQAWLQFQEHNDADFAYAFVSGHCRLRVNFFLDRLGPGFVCRVIPNEIPDPARLGLELPIQRLAQLAKGLVLVTGPTGSGKSTTLAALIDLANQQRSDHILTIEDPIEFVHQRKRCLVNQREAGNHTESFKSGLRAALREDPDIVMVGEMRDLETIAIALETAVTGHLVFGTLHTSSAVGTIDRIVDQFPAERQQQIRVMLADSLKCVVSQILLKRKGGGRIAALESLFINPAISNLIREGKNFQIPSAMQTGRAYGQKLMNDVLIELIQSGQVELKEAYLKAPDKETYMAALKRAGIDWDPRTQPGALD